MGSDQTNQEPAAMADASTAPIAQAKSLQVFAFVCRIYGRPEFGAPIINERTAGRAKRRAWDFALSADDRIKFTDIRVRKVGPPQSSDHFLHTAAYRGLPHLRCGMRVVTEGIEGVIVDCGGGANFSVLADRDGTIYCCHPDYFKSIDGVPMAEWLQKHPRPLETWSQFQWPEWVPVKVRENVVAFWTSFSRDLKDWLENNASPYNYQPPLGALVDCRQAGGDTRFIGRWVPAWNNIGWIVFPDGSYEQASTCGIKVLEQEVAAHG